MFYICTSLHKDLLYQIIVTLSSPSGLHVEFYFPTHSEYLMRDMGQRTQLFIVFYMFPVYYLH